ncbi:unnamed protein product [Gongylonema pulchrum]|uniref:Regulator of chromosome condensation (RCC1) repeat-containing protein n=1 Tax=Gongylonema pulchrum TaxID=637853 RepID=A0A183F033_9BILA|nr:unnamed protein product [Gongylonema pulchrum]
MARRELYAFGCDSDGQLGSEPSTGDNSGCVRLPQFVYGSPTGPYGVTVKAVACGEKHTLFLADDGKVRHILHLKYLLWSVSSAMKKLSFSALHRVVVAD